MQFFKRKSKVASRVGLVMQSDYMALTHVMDQDGVPAVLNCECQAVESAKEAASILERLVKKLGLEGKQVSYVLNPRDYHLHLVEAPKVEPEEMRSAVRWKIKDVLDMKIEDAAIDVFQVPEDAYRGREMLYVVASPKSRIRSIVDTVSASGLELAVIDIPELVMHNIASRFLGDEQGVAFMELRRSGSTMNISRAEQLYLTRRINTQLDHDVMRSANWDSLKDRLVLEIERSLDYFESQMGQGAVERIVIAPRQHDGAALTEELNRLLPTQVVSLNLAQHVQSDTALSPEMQQQALPALGATLRGSRPRPAQSGEGKATTGKAAEGQQAA